MNKSLIYKENTQKKKKKMFEAHCLVDLQEYPEFRGPKSKVMAFRRTTTHPHNESLFRSLI